MVSLFMTALTYRFIAITIPLGEFLPSQPLQHGVDTANE